MELIQTVRKTDLARNTHRIIQKVLRGQTAVIESHGQPEAVIVDIIDYYLQRAAIKYYAQSDQDINQFGLDSENVRQQASDEERYNLVVAHYLSESISLGRAAELLELPQADLQLRLVNLGIPLRQGPATSEEARQDVINALTAFKL